jgi:hypothetical protein
MTSPADITVEVNPSLLELGGANIPDPNPPAILIFVHVKDLVFPMEVTNPKRMWFGEFKTSLIEQSKVHTPLLSALKTLRHIEIVHLIKDPSGGGKAREYTSFEYDDEFHDVKHLELFSRCHVTVNILTDQMLQDRLQSKDQQEQIESNWRKCLLCIIFPFKMIYLFFYYLFKCLFCFLDCVE